MQGVLVGVPRSALPPAAKDEYYWADLIGLDVVNTHDQLLGQVLGLIETSANDVFRVGDGEGAERLLPFVASVVLDVDMTARRIRVDWEADW
jgi:16S rRNA processing protein RimM